MVKIKGREDEGKDAVKKSLRKVVDKFVTKVHIIFLSAALPPFFLLNLSSPFYRS
jgi:hypothetical protein